MNSAKPKRRWLQFSLRSLLLITLALALWLGYEVRQARLTEGHRRAIEALGGRVETQPRGLSFLRFVVGGDFGQQVVAAEIPGQSVDDATNTLASMPYLRRVRVVYDGTCDLHPDWDELNSALPDKTIEPATAYSYEPREVERVRCFSKSEPLLKRCAKKMEQGPGKVQELLRDLKERPTSLEGFANEDTTPMEWFEEWYGLAYHVRQLEDGTVVELLSVNKGGFSVPGTDAGYVVLLVEDRAIDGAVHEVSTEHGRPDVQLVDSGSHGAVGVGFEYVPRARFSGDKHGRQIPGDSRFWLGLYRIERDGFKSLLPEAEPSP